MRPIDADALALEVKKWFVIPDNRKTMKEAIDHAPTLDYEPVRHGEWVPYGDDDQYEGSYLCSECKAENFFAFDERHYHYCPNCGAKMGKGDA